MPEEFGRCRPFLERELELLRKVRVVVTLGKLAHDTYLGILQAHGAIASRKEYEFGHGRTHRPPGGPVVISSYHPSQQNTLTGKLTEAMFRRVFEEARREAANLFKQAPNMRQT